MLSGIEATKEKVLRIILAGQPELNEKLDSPELVQLTQRIRLRFHLGALSREDLRSYVLHRLEVAGADGREIFAEDTYPGNLQLHRRRAAPGQHAVRHRHDGRLQRRPRLRDAGGHRLPRSTELQWVEFSSRATADRRPSRPTARTRPASDRPRGAFQAGAVHRGQGRGRAAPDAGAQGHRPHARTTICRSTANSSAGITASSSPAAMGMTVIEDLNSTNGHPGPRQARAPPYAARRRRRSTIGQHEMLYVDEHAPEHLRRRRTTTCRASTSDAANEDARAMTHHRDDAAARALKRRPIEKGA